MAGFADPTVRRARHDDVPVLVDLDFELPAIRVARRCSPAAPTFTHEEAVADAKESIDSADYAIFVVERDGRVVGSSVGCALTESSAHTGPARPDDAGFLGFAAVLPEARGTGAGRAVGDAVLAWAARGRLSQRRHRLAGDQPPVVTGLATARFPPDVLPAAPPQSGTSPRRAAAASPGARRARDASSIVLGTTGVLPSAISRNVRRRILPDRVLGSAATTSIVPQRRDRTDLVAHLLHQLRAQLVVVDVHARLQHHETARDLPLQVVVHAHDRTLGHGRMPGQHGLQRARRQPVAGDVDDVVGAAHHEQVAVLVDVAAVAGEVVAVERRQVGRDEALVVAPQRRQRSRRQRQLDADRTLGAGNRLVRRTARAPARPSRARARSASRA